MWKLRMSQVMIFFSFVFLHLVVSPICALPLAPALYVFGDSLMDSGNNNFLPTLAKANYLPYGADFPTGPSGRFTNGKTVADLLAEYLGLPYSPPFLSFEGPRSLTGINYASGSCGILPETGALLGKCLNVEEQINLFQRTIEVHLPREIKIPTQLSEHLSKSIFVFSIGSNDYINNYLETNFYGTSKHYLPRPFAQLLIEKLSKHFEVQYSSPKLTVTLMRMYKLGARKIIMFELGPVGCIPAVARKHPHTGDCVEKTNQMVAYFNNRLSPMLKNMTSNHPGSTFVLGRANSLGYDAIKNPSLYGLTDKSNPCCTTWANGTSGCIPFTKPCMNPSEHVFWDAFHLTEAVYSVIASACISNRSVCTPMSVQELVKV
ncbi:GDSL esterase/lipase 7, partial [Mucuna pruriens]